MMGGFGGGGIGGLMFSPKMLLHTCWKEGKYTFGIGCTMSSRSWCASLGAVATDLGAV